MLARNFISSDFKINTWEALKPFFVSLLEFEINSKEDLKKWLLNRSELDSIISEDLGWRYIKMTCDTQNETLKASYEDFITNIQFVIFDGKKAHFSFHVVMFGFTN